MSIAAVMKITVFFLFYRTFTGVGSVAIRYPPSYVVRSVADDG